MFGGSNTDDEFSDRINYRYTVGLLMFFTVTLSTRQYTSEVSGFVMPKGHAIKIFF